MLKKIILVAGMAGLLAGCSHDRYKNNSSGGAGYNGGSTSSQTGSKTSTSGYDSPSQGSGPLSTTNSWSGSSTNTSTSGNR